MELQDIKEYDVRLCVELIRYIIIYSDKTKDMTKSDMDTLLSKVFNADTIAKAHDFLKGKG